MKKIDKKGCFAAPLDDGGANDAQIAGSAELTQIGELLGKLAAGDEVNIEFVVKKKLPPVVVGLVEMPIYYSINHGKRRYQVPHYPDSPDKRVLKEFDNLDDARAFARETADGQNAQKVIFSHVTAEELEAVVEAISILHPLRRELKLSVREVIEEYRVAKLLAHNSDLRDVVRAYVVQPWIVKQRTLLREVVEEFLSDKIQNGYRPATITSLKTTLLAWDQNVGPKALINVTVADINSAIYDSARRYAILHDFFEWCKSKGYYPAHVACPMDSVKSPIAHGLRPAIIDVPIAAQVLQTLANQTDPKYALYVAIGLFAGLRSTECIRMRWDSVSPGGSICVSSRYVGHHLSRMVPIGPALDAWMKPFYCRSGLVFKRKTIHRLLSKVLKQANLSWVISCLRQSFASYRTALTGNAQQVASELGQSPKTVAPQHHNLGSVAQAQDFFALTPEACGITNWDDIVNAFLARSRTRKKRR